MFRVGDIVKVIDDSSTGKVVKYVGAKVTILNEFGFEEIYSESELILNQSFVIDDVIVKEEFKPKISKSKRPDFIEVDLHIGHLVDYPGKFSNYDMLQVQLRKVEQSIEEARVKQVSRIIFIHGHGSGKLREELHAMLDAYTKIEYYDASFQRYKLGATEVKLL